ncbi:MAG: hypothetical protein EOR84_05105 [Mesorhizobium sp.]|uniref:LysE family translocator n=1 Tax=Mesorhizobium sp. TaxID=1871066 RepID=UPI000FE5A643|nr:LysE family transporter [Mesorhizobium sp.]RWN02215.1 MAG: hypothetical protein EOR84_05105 [Mesorhizobium sp.]
MFEFVLTGMPQFLAAYAVILVTPGPITFATGSLATLSGLPRAMPFVIGIGTGAASLTAFLGLMAESVSATVPLPVLHLAGTALLIWMAVRIIRMPMPAGTPVRNSKGSLGGLVLAGFLTPLSSPLDGFFLMAMFTGPVLSQRELGTVASIAVTVGVVNLAWYMLVAIVFARLSAWHRPIRTVGAALLTSLAMLSAWSALGSG